MNDKRVANPFLFGCAKQQGDTLHLGQRKLGQRSLCAIHLLFEEAGGDDHYVVFTETTWIVGVADRFNNLAGGIYAH